MQQVFKILKPKMRKKGIKMQQKQSFGRKALALVLSFVLALSMLPTTAFASGEIIGFGFSGKIMITASKDGVTDGTLRITKTGGSNDVAMTVRINHASATAKVGGVGVNLSEATPLAIASNQATTSDNLHSSISTAVGAYSKTKGQQVTFSFPGDATWVDIPLKIFQATDTMLDSYAYKLELAPLPIGVTTDSSVSDSSAIIILKPSAEEGGENVDKLGELLSISGEVSQSATSYSLPTSISGLTDGGASVALTAGTNGNWYASSDTSFSTSLTTVNPSEMTVGTHNYIFKPSGTFAANGGENLNNSTVRGKFTLTVKALNYTDVTLDTTNVSDKVYVINSGDTVSKEKLTENLIVNAKIDGQDRTLNSSQYTVETAINGSIITVTITAGTSSASYTVEKVEAKVTSLTVTQNAYTFRKDSAVTEAELLARLQAADSNFGFTINYEGNLSETYAKGQIGSLLSIDMGELVGTAQTVTLATIRRAAEGSNNAATITLTVNPTAGAIESIEATADSASIYTGQNASKIAFTNLVVETIDEYGARVAINTGYTTSFEAQVGIDNSGIVTATNGTVEATITYNADGKDHTAKVNVNVSPVELSTDPAPTVSTGNSLGQAATVTATFAGEVLLASAGSIEFVKDSSKFTLTATTANYDSTTKKTTVTYSGTIPVTNASGDYAASAITGVKAGASTVDVTATFATALTTTVASYTVASIEVTPNAVSTIQMFTGDSLNSKHAAAETYEEALRKVITVTETPAGTTDKITTTNYTLTIADQTGAASGKVTANTGNVTVTVTVGDKTATFTVPVKAVAVKSVTMAHGNGYEYAEGDTASNIQATVVFDRPVTETGSTLVLANTTLNVILSPSATTTATTNADGTYTVTYEGKLTAAAIGTPTGATYSASTLTGVVNVAGTTTAIANAFTPAVNIKVKTPTVTGVKGTWKENTVIYTGDTLTHLKDLVAVKELTSITLNNAAEPTITERDYTGAFTLTGGAGTGTSPIDSGIRVITSTGIDAGFTVTAGGRTSANFTHAVTLVKVTGAVLGTYEGTTFTPATAEDKYYIGDEIAVKVTFNSKVRPDSNYINTITFTNADQTQYFQLGNATAGSSTNVIMVGDSVDNSTELIYIGQIPENQTYNQYAGIFTAIAIDNVIGQVTPKIQHLNTAVSATNKAFTPVSLTIEEEPITNITLTASNDADDKIYVGDSTIPVELQSELIVKANTDVNGDGGFVLDSDKYELTVTGYDVTTATIKATFKDSDPELSDTATVTAKDVKIEDTELIIEGTAGNTVQDNSAQDVEVKVYFTREVNLTGTSIVIENSDPVTLVELDFVDGINQEITIEDGVVTQGYVASYKGTIDGNNTDKKLAEGAYTATAITGTDITLKSTNPSVANYTVSKDFASEDTVTINVSPRELKSITAALAEGSKDFKFVTGEDVTNLTVNDITVTGTMGYVTQMNRAVPESTFTRILDTNEYEISFDGAEGVEGGKVTADSGTIIATITAAGVEDATLSIPVEPVKVTGAEITSTETTYTSGKTFEVTVAFNKPVDATGSTLVLTTTQAPTSRVITLLPENVSSTENGTDSTKHEVVYSGVIPFNENETANYYSGSYSVATITSDITVDGTSTTLLAANKNFTKVDLTVANPEPTSVTLTAGSSATNFKVGDSIDGFVYGADENYTVSVDYSTGLTAPDDTASYTLADETGVTLAIDAGGAGTSTKYIGETSYSVTATYAGKTSAAVSFTADQIEVTTAEIGKIGTDNAFAVSATASVRDEIQVRLTFDKDVTGEGSTVVLSDGASKTITLAYGGVDATNSKTLIYGKVLVDGDFSDTDFTADAITGDVLIPYGTGTDTGNITLTNPTFTEVSMTISNSAPIITGTPTFSVEGKTVDASNNYCAIIDDTIKAVFSTDIELDINGSTIKLFGQTATVTETTGEHNYEATIIVDGSAVISQTNAFDYSLAAVDVEDKTEGKGNINNIVVDITVLQIDVNVQVFDGDTTTERQEKDGQIFMSDADKLVLTVESNKTLVLDPAKTKAVITFSDGVAESNATFELSGSDIAETSAGSKKYTITKKFEQYEFAGLSIDKEISVTIKVTAEDTSGYKVDSQELLYPQIVGDFGVAEITYSTGSANSNNIANNATTKHAIVGNTVSFEFTSTKRLNTTSTDNIVYIGKVDVTNTNMKNRATIALKRGVTQPDGSGKYTYVATVNSLQKPVSGSGYNATTKKLIAQFVKLVCENGSVVTSGFKPNPTNTTVLTFEDVPAITISDINFKSNNANIALAKDGDKAILTFKATGGKLMFDGKTSYVTIADTNITPAVSGSASPYTYTAEVTVGNNGTFINGLPITFALKPIGEFGTVVTGDTWNNLSAGVTGAVTYDSEAKILNADLSTNNKISNVAYDGDVLTLTFDSSEPLYGNSNALLAASDITIGGKTPNSLSSNYNGITKLHSYTAILNVNSLTTTPAAAIEVVITAKDLAGNAATIGNTATGTFTSTIIYNSLQGVTLTSIQNNSGAVITNAAIYAKATDTITATFTSTADLTDAIAKLVSEDGKINITGSAITGSANTYTTTFTLGNYATVDGIKLDISLAGNGLTFTPSPAMHVVYGVNLPEITVTSATLAGGFTGDVVADDSIVVTFTTNVEIDLTNASNSLTLGTEATEGTIAKIGDKKYTATFTVTEDSAETDGTFKLNGTLYNVAGESNATPFEIVLAGLKMGETLPTITLVTDNITNDVLANGQTVDITVASGDIKVGDIELYYAPTVYGNYTKATIALPTDGATPADITLDGETIGSITYSYADPTTTYAISLDKVGSYYLLVNNNDGSFVDDCSFKVEQNITIVVDSSAAADGLESDEVITVTSTGGPITSANIKIDSLILSRPPSQKTVTVETLPTAVNGTSELKVDGNAIGAVKLASVNNNAKEYKYEISITTSGSYYLKVVNMDGTTADDCSFDVKGSKIVSATLKIDETDVTTSTPAIEVGNVLTAGAILDNNNAADAAKLTFKWEISNNGSTGWTALAGTASTYTVKEADLLKFIRVTVTGTSGLTGSAQAKTVKINGGNSLHSVSVDKSTLTGDGTVTATAKNISNATITGVTYAWAITGTGTLPTLTNVDTAAVTVNTTGATAGNYTLTVTATQGLVTKTATAIVKVEGATVATIGTNNYTTLKAAVAAAKDGEIITMTANSAETEEIIVNKSIIIDGTATKYSVAAGIKVEAGNVTIKNLKLTGSVEGDDNDAVIFVKESANLTVDNATVEATANGVQGILIYNSAGRTVVRNSTISATGTLASGIYLGSPTTATIVNNTITGADDAMTIEHVDNSFAAYNIYGNTFNANNYKVAIFFGGEGNVAGDAPAIANFGTANSNSLAAGSTNGYDRLVQMLIAQAKGGNITISNATNSAEKYEVNANGNVTKYYFDSEWQAIDAVAIVGTTAYATLQDAIDSIEDDTATTVEMIADSTEGNGAATTDDKFITIPVDRDITINGNGKTINVGIKIEETATINNLNFNIAETSHAAEGNNGDRAVIFVSSGAAATVEKCNITTAATGVQGIFVDNDAISATINNNTISATGSLARGLYVAYDASLTITNNTIVGEREAFVVEGINNDTTAPTASITGNKFYTSVDGYKVAIFYSTEKPNIAGFGTATSQTKTDVDGSETAGYAAFVRALLTQVANGKVTIQKAPGVSATKAGEKYTVANNAITAYEYFNGTVWSPFVDHVAEIGGNPYTTLALAVEAATDGATINMVANSLEATPIEISKNLTINGNGHSIEAGIKVSSAADAINVTIYDLTLNIGSENDAVEVDADNKAAMLVDGKAILTADNIEISTIDGVEGIFVDTESHVNITNSTIKAGKYGIYARSINSLLSGSGKLVNNKIYGSYAALGIEEVQNNTASYNITGNTLTAGENNFAALIFHSTEAGNNNVPNVANFGTLTGMTLTGTNAYIKLVNRILAQAANNTLISVRNKDIETSDDSGVRGERYTVFAPESGTRSLINKQYFDTTDKAWKDITSGQSLNQAIVLPSAPQTAPKQDVVEEEVVEDEVTDEEVTEDEATDEEVTEDEEAVEDEVVDEEDSAITEDEDTTTEDDSYEVPSTEESEESEESTTETEEQPSETESSYEETTTEAEVANVA